ncbi:MAG: general secretion pathway protein GspC, partial [Proteobacteria bacterium]|nr:general secretion pathway protein GspC [Pseudomonadota bacterium]
LIDAREIEQANANMSQLMTQIRVVPNFSDGQPDGFKVFAIRPGSLFSKIGLQNGDVLKRVNGVDLQGPEQAFEAYQMLKDETSIQIDLVRRNENKTFNYEIR